MKSLLEYQEPKMSLTLNELCEKASVDPKYIDRKSFDKLKKSIHLQIKANGGIGLDFGENFYTKEEITNFIEYYESSFQIPELVNDEEDVNINVSEIEKKSVLDWHSPLKNPTQLTDFFEIPSDLLETKKRIEAQMLVDRLYADEIVRSIQVLFSEMNFKGIVFLNSYEHVCSNQLIFKYKSALLTIFNNFYNKEKLRLQSKIEIANDDKNAHYFDFMFFSVGTMLHDIDQTVASKYLDLVNDFCASPQITTLEKKDVYQLLIKMPHDTEDMRDIRKKINSYYEVISIHAANSRSALVDNHNATTKPASTQKSYSLKEIIIGVAFISGLIFLISKCVQDRAAKSAKAETFDEFMETYNSTEITGLSKADLEELEGIEPFYLGDYYDKDDAILDYNATIKQLNKNIKNESILSYFKNTVSMFCYKTLADSLGGFEYEDASIPKKGYCQAEFTSESDCRSILFVAYNVKDSLAKPRALLIKPFRSNQDDTKFYVSKDEMVFVVVNPQIKNNKVIYGDIWKVEAYNLSFEAYQLTSAEPKRATLLFYSDSKKYPDQVSLLHLYSTMCFYKLNKPYRFNRS